MSEIGDINYIDTPNLLDLNISGNALAQMQSSSVPNLNSNDSPSKRGKNIEGSSTNFGD
jgi:hypothetical protein